MMAGTAGLDGDYSRCELLEERHHLLAPHLLAQNWHLGGIHPVKLKNVFRRIHPNSANLVHGRSPLSEIIHTTSFWHARCRRGPSTPTTLTLVANSAPGSGGHLQGSE